MGLEDYCVEGTAHSWTNGSTECDCGYDLCLLECTECDAVDKYCENQ